MTRSLLIIALCLTALFSLLPLVMRAQPTEDPRLGQLLQQDTGCIAPCFINIRPGSTTLNEALDSLARNPWVNTETIQHVTLPQSPSNFDKLDAIHWEWLPARPDYLVVVPNLPDGLINLRNNLVADIFIMTPLHLGSLLYRFGAPSDLLFYFSRTDPKPWGLDVYYTQPAYRFVFRVRAPACPDVASVLRQAVQMQFSAPTDRRPFTIEANAEPVRLTTQLIRRKHLLLCEK